MEDRTAAECRLEQRRTLVSWRDELDTLDRLRDDDPPAALDRAETLAGAFPSATEAHLLAGRTAVLCEHFERALAHFQRATDIALPDTLDFDHPYTPLYTRAQLALPREALPSYQRVSENRAKNVAALRSVDPLLADEVERATDPAGVRLVDLWGRIAITNETTGAYAVGSAPTMAALAKKVSHKDPLVKFGVGSGQELLWMLENTPRAFLGETCPHYLFERDSSRVRLFLGMDDLASALRERRLIIFGGSRWDESAARLFATRRYAVPTWEFGDRGNYDPRYSEIIATALPTTSEHDDVVDYYRSDEFNERLERIARGEIAPRLLLTSSRWTTVLRYVCATFRRGFQSVGCRTKFLIEHSDVETTTMGTVLKTLAEFKPDVCFAVSHCRASGFVPPGLPFVSFVMDNCGPILTSARLDKKIDPRDIFVSINRKFQRMLEDKGVPSEQISVMVTPGDSRDYHVLDADDPRLAPFRCDVSLARHAGAGGVEQCMRQFEKSVFTNSSSRAQNVAKFVVRAVHAKVKSDPSRQWYDEDIWKFAKTLLDANLPERWIQELRATLVQYKVVVYSASFRQSYLVPLGASDLDLRLYGNGWDRHPEYRRFARGPVKPGVELNLVYNASAVNLHIHNEMSMHQRLVDGALAGGFFLVNRLDPERDYEPLTRYYEDGREYVSFEDGEDLLDKCRYYLAHPDERRDIGERMRVRAKESYTLEKCSEAILEKLRERLRESIAG